MRELIARILPTSAGSSGPVLSICVWFVQVGGVRLGSLPEQFQRLIGAGEGIRTLDPNLGKVVLYP